jgi:hypothetical protein
MNCMDRRYKDDGFWDRPSNSAQKIERTHGDIPQVGLRSDQVTWLIKQIISIKKGLIPGLERQF